MNVSVSEIHVLLGAEIELQTVFDLQPTLQRGEAFNRLAQSAFQQLARHPHSGGRFLNSSFRRLVLAPTCYALFYQVEGRRVMVHALLDLRQDPEAIRRRLGL
ncbi:MAG TPA: hypothetical protein VF593_08180 [Chthoniobacteraceae bacterium]